MNMYMMYALYGILKQESLDIAKMTARCAHNIQAIHPNFVHAYGHYTLRGF